MGDRINAVTDFAVSLSFVIFEFLRAVIYERLMHVPSVFADWLDSGGATRLLTLLLAVAAFAALLLGIPNRDWLAKWLPFGRKVSSARDDSNIRVLTHEDRERQRRTLARLLMLLERELDGILDRVNWIAAEWRTILLQNGHEQFSKDLTKSKNAVRQLVRKFEATIRNCRSPNKQLLQPLGDLRFCAELIDAIDRLKEAAGKLPDRVQSRTLDLLLPQRDDFAAQVAFFKRRVAALERDIVAATQALDGEP